MSSLIKRFMPFSIYACFLILVSFVYAETPFDFTECASVKIIPVFKNKDITIGGL